MMHFLDNLGGGEFEIGLHHGSKLPRGLPVSKVVRKPRKD